MVCAEFTNINNLGDLLVWPTSCNYWFYLIVLATIFIVLTLILFNRQKESEIRADIVSSLGVSSIAIIVLALIGTLIKNSADIPMIQSDIFLYVFAFGIIFILIWFFKK